MPTIHDRPFYDQLIDNLSHISVPDSFTHRDVDLRTLYFDIFVYVGFNSEASTSIAAEIIGRDRSALSLTETVTSWITKRWREVHANEALIPAQGQPLDAFRKTLAQAYISIGVIEEFAVKCTTFISWDPLRNIIDIMEESIHDALTLRNLYLKNKITRRREGNSG
jgi:hypothetical protein